MENVKGIAYAIVKGFTDSLRGTLKVFHLDNSAEQRAGSVSRRTPPRELSTLAKRRAQQKEKEGKDTVKKNESPRVLHRIIQCSALNGGVFWLSIFVFHSGLLPWVKYCLQLMLGGSSGMNLIIWGWMKPMLSWTFSTLWVLPLFLLSKIINSLWFQDIADSAYRSTRGRPQLLTSFSKLIADTLFSIMIQALFLVQGMLVSLLPIVAVGELVSLIHMCLLYSLYAFEYKWFNMGWELHKRLTFIENNWPYFIGFGLPLSLLTAYPSSYVISGCVFSILFPLFIISGNEATPVTGVCDYPLQLFLPTIAISNAIFHRTMKPRTSDTASSSIRR